MKSPSKAHYFVVVLILTLVLTGCELRRNSDEISDPGPVSDVPPTLAPLGAETDLVGEATGVPTVINVDPTATEGTLGEGEAADSGEISAPTTQPVDLAATEAPAVSSEAVEGAAAAEEFAPTAEEAAATEPAEAEASEESIIVDANAEDLPSGGPVASNPPASQTTGEYDSSASAAPYGGSYTVQAGDTLFSIAQRHGTSVEAIVYANGLRSDYIYAGQVLDIPAGDGGGYAPPPGPDYGYEQPPYPQPGPGGGVYHRVAPGETLYRISLQYGTSVEAIAGVNGIPYPYTIQVGQELMIPEPGPYAGPPPPAPADGYYPQQPPQGYYPEQPPEGYYPQQPPAEEYYPQQPPEGYYPPQDDGYGAPPPGGAQTHTVAPGETLFSIAMRYGTQAEALAAANGLSNPNQIYVGQVLYLP